MKNNMFDIALTIMLFLFVSQSVDAQTKKGKENVNVNKTISSVTSGKEDAKEKTATQLQLAFDEIIIYANQLIGKADSLQGEGKKKCLKIADKCFEVLEPYYIDNDDVLNQIKKRRSQIKKDLKS